MDEEGIPTYRLLQPELLTRAELVGVLQRYNLKCDIRTSDIKELISIYKRLALPLPQRVYGSTWRERLLAKKQNRRKISLTDTKANTDVSSKSTSSSNSLQSPVNRLAQRDRLKPPVDTSKTKEKKIIRISSSSTKDADNSAIANDTNKKSSEPLKTDSSEEKGQSKLCRKRIKIDFSDSSERSTPLPKVVSTKRLSTSSDEKGPSQPVSKHRRIVI